MTWLTSDILDKSITALINAFEKQDDYTYIQATHYTAFAEQNYHPLVDFLCSCDPLNLDIIFVSINTDTQGEGSHWVLGIIFLQMKVIAICDSLGSNNDRRTQFQELNKILYCIHRVCDMSVDDREYSYFIVRDCKTQQNFYDCGLYVIYNVYSFLRRTPFFSLESDSGRTWIHSILNSGFANFNFNYGQVIADVEVARDIEDNIAFINHPPSEIKDLWPIAQQYFASLNRNWTICGLGDKCVPDESHIHTHFKCVLCRLWFHEKCIEGLPELFYVCASCKINK